MSKSRSKTSCRWGWLYSHPKSDEIIKYVTGETDSVSESLTKGSLWDRIELHRFIVIERSKRKSLRFVSVQMLASGCKVSHEQVRLICRKYLVDRGKKLPHEPTAKTEYKLRIADFMRDNPGELERFQSGLVDTRGLAGRIGGGVSPAHVRYWAKSCNIKYPKGRKGSGS